MNKAQIQTSLSGILETMREIADDFTIPKNIRRAIKEGVERLQDKGEDISIAIATTVYSLDELSNDINIPSHARTSLWSVVSELEKLKKDMG